MKWAYRLARPETRSQKHCGEENGRQLIDIYGGPATEKARQKRLIETLGVWSATAVSVSR